MLTRIKTFINAKLHNHLINQGFIPEIQEDGRILYYHPFPDNFEEG